MGERKGLYSRGGGVAVTRNDCGYSSLCGGKKWALWAAGLLLGSALQGSLRLGTARPRCQKCVEWLGISAEESACKRTSPFRGGVRTAFVIQSRSFTLLPRTDTVPTRFMYAAHFSDLSTRGLSSRLSRVLAREPGNTVPPLLPPKIHPIPSCLSIPLR